MSISKYQLYLGTQSENILITKIPTFFRCRLNSVDDINEELIRSITYKYFETMYNDYWGVLEKKNFKEDVTTDSVVHFCVLLVKDNEIHRYVSDVNGWRSGIIDPFGKYKLGAINSDQFYDSAPVKAFTDFMSQIKSDFMQNGFTRNFTNDYDAFVAWTNSDIPVKYVDNAPKANISMKFISCKYGTRQKKDELLIYSTSVFKDEDLTDIEFEFYYREFFRGLGPFCRIWSRSNNGKYFYGYIMLSLESDGQSRTYVSSFSELVDVWIKPFKDGNTLGGYETYPWGGHDSTESVQGLQFKELLIELWSDMNNGFKSTDMYTSREVRNGNDNEKPLNPPADFRLYLGIADTFVLSSRIPDISLIDDDFIAKLCIEFYKQESRIQHCSGPFIIWVCGDSFKPGKRNQAYYKAYVDRSSASYHPGDPEIDINKADLSDNDYKKFKNSLCVRMLDKFIREVVIDLKDGYFQYWNRSWQEYSDESSYNWDNIKYLRAPEKKEVSPVKSNDNPLMAAANIGNTTAGNKQSDTSAGDAIDWSQYTIIQDVDTRDNSVLWVVKPNTFLGKDKFSEVNDAMKKIGGYYSKFKHGFIFRKEPNK